MLFRTRFRDGTSIVERTAQRSTGQIEGGKENAIAAARNSKGGKGRNTGSDVALSNRNE